MAELFTESGPVYYVEVDDTLCNGCVLCMKACPTKAIRVRDNVASIEGTCIDCVECVRVCPRGAIKAIAAESFDLSRNSEYVVSPSTVLYSQFGPDVLPNDVLLGLKKLGFKYPHDQSYTSEIYNYATEVYIRECRKRPDAPFPLISAVCPVVVRLIAYRFPALLAHIPPLLTPREIVTREAKKRFSSKEGVLPADVKVLHITPCPAMLIQVTQPAFQDPSYRDVAIGINSIYEPLNKSVQEIDDDRVYHYSSGIGLGWGKSGGEIAGLDANCLAVSGLHETIRYLEKVEMGLLSHIHYLECRVCQEGCIGGPFTVADRYQTKHLVLKLVRMFGVEKRIKYNYIIRLYNEGWFRRDEPFGAAEGEPKRHSISERIERQKRVEEMLKILPRKECGVCGSPDCRAFAEDMVDGKAVKESCVYLENKPNKAGGRR